MLCKGTKGLRQTVWSWTKVFSPNICDFVAILKFVTLLGSVFFWVKTMFHGQELHDIWYLLHTILSSNRKFAFML